MMSGKLAKDACKNCGITVSDHIEDILDMIALDIVSKREIDNVKFSWYPC